MGNVLGQQDRMENYKRMASYEGNLVRVRLVDVQLSKLGVILSDSESPPRVQVRDLVPGGMLERTGLVHRGDSVIQVNGFDTCEMSSTDVERLLSRLGPRATLTLILRGPAHCRTYLRTVFQADGMPKTLRVTEPLTPRNVRAPGPPGQDGDRADRHEAAPPPATPALAWGDGQKPEAGTSDAQAEVELRNGQDEQCSFKEKVSKNGSTIPPKKTGRSSIRRRKTEQHLACAPQEKLKVNRKHSFQGATDKRSTSPCAVNGKEKGLGNSPDGSRSTSPRRTSRSHGSPTLGRNAELAGTLEMEKTPLSRRRSSQRSDWLAKHGKKVVKLRNLQSDTVTTDSLHSRALEGTTPCGGATCGGSYMWPVKYGPEPLRSKDEVMRQAREFFEEYYTSIKRGNSPAHQKRWGEVCRQIEATGTYEQTLSELTFGAKTAWRNAPRCIGRIQWSKLQVFDARHIKTARGMFEALCNHIKYATNKGNIRSAITLFPARTDGQHDFRVWNSQIISYAGYKQPDGKVIGDNGNVEFTELCMKLGWRGGSGGMFDVLPLLLQANGNDPEIYDVPQDLILEVNLEHQKYPWFKDLGLKWYGVPAVSSMMLDCGGLQFTAAPFNGWYMGTEIGARDLCEKNRYNLMERIADRIGLDTRKPASLWKDQVLLEVNIAVLQSFQRDRVTISDHHSTADSFMKHLENEARVRGGCPADWVWINPPMSSSITPVFHQEMIRYHLKPSFEYQVEPWLTHSWKKSKDKKKSPGASTRRKIGFKELARAVKFSAKLMGKALANRIKCTILYATETGKSETYAKRLCEIFEHAFNTKMLCMDEYDPIELEHEALVLIVTSTFGNGDPPDNGKEFGKGLLDMLHQDKTYFSEQSSASQAEPRPVPDRGTMLRVESLGSSRIQVARRRSSNFDLSKDSIDHGVGTLANVSFSVFGLGSRAYPKFCEFAKLVTRLFSDLGGELIFPPAEGDELCGQEQAFQVWADGVFRAACETFCVVDDVNFAAATESLKKNDSSWAPGKYRLTPLEGEEEADLPAALAKLHNKNVFQAKLIRRTDLQSKTSSRQTILVELHTDSNEVSYVPGDHVGIFPANQQAAVQAILSRLHNAPDPDQVVKLETFKERPVFMGPGRQWYADKRLPPMTLRTAFSRYLDVTAPPTPDLLLQLSGLADEADAKTLQELANDSTLYDEWKFGQYPNLATVLEEFSSLRVSPTLLLSQLPLLQPRFYSISSSPVMHPGEIHATVAVVSFTTHSGGEVVHHGVCSSWLNTLPVDSTIPCFVRTAPSFHLPTDESVPLIMVGPGTGIAPFRAFWQQRRVDRDMKQVPSGGSGSGWGAMTLYSGCRQAKVDNIYDDEKSRALEEGVLGAVHTALSREPHIPKAYVQDLMVQNAATIYQEVVQKAGHFYVCGDVAMAAEVFATLEKIVLQEGQMTREDAKQFVLKLRENNRFHEDIFGVTLRTSEVHDKKRDEARKFWTKSAMSQKSVELFQNKSETSSQRSLDLIT